MNYQVIQELLSDWWICAENEIFSAQSKGSDKRSNAKWHRCFIRLELHRAQIARNDESPQLLFSSIICALIQKLSSTYTPCIEHFLKAYELLGDGGVSLSGVQPHRLG
jgi:hypothetical protein